MVKKKSLTPVNSPPQKKVARSHNLDTDVEVIEAPGAMPAWPDTWADLDEPEEQQQLHDDAEWVDTTMLKDLEKSMLASLKSTIVTTLAESHSGVHWKLDQLKATCTNLHVQIS